MNKRQLCRELAFIVLSVLTIVSVNSLSSVVSAEAPEMNFRDDFASTSLRPEWDVVDQDIKRWELVDNDYLLLVIKDEKNKFCYRYEVPDRYEFMLKTLVTDLDYGDNFYISIDNADNDGIKMIISSGILTFKKTLGDDKAQTLKQATNVSDKGADYYMKIQKTGIEYIGYVSRDGNRWTEVGKYYFPKFVGSPCFGGLSTTRGEKAVKVDFVELKALR